MKKVHYPYKRIRPSVTIRCNRRCPYCADTKFQPELYRADEFEEVDPSLWIEGLLRLEGNFDVVFGTGEPALYEGLVDVVDALPEKLTWIYTNGTPDAVDIYMDCKPRGNLRFYMSYHHGQIAPELFAEGAKRIASKFKVWNHHSPPYPPFVEKIEQDKRVLAKLGIKLSDHPFNGFYKGQVHIYKDLPVERFDKKRLRRVWCRTSFGHADFYSQVYPVAPDGTLYVCYRRHFERSQNPEHIVGNLFGDLAFEDRHYKCDDYGYCHLCAWHRSIIDRDTGEVLDNDT